MITINHYSNDSILWTRVERPKVILLWPLLASLLDVSDCSNPGTTLRIGCLTVLRRARPICWYESKEDRPIFRVQRELRLVHIFQQVVVLSLTAAPDSLCGKARNSWPKMLLQTRKIVMLHFLARLFKHDTACLWSCSGCNDWRQGKECFLAFIKKATWVLTSAPESCADYSLTDDVIGDKENCYSAVLLPRWFKHDHARCWSYTACCDWRLSWTYPLTPLLVVYAKKSGKLLKSLRNVNERIWNWWRQREAYRVEE